MSRALRRQPLVQKPPAKSTGFRPSAPRPVKKTEATIAAEAIATKRLPFYLRAVPRPIRKFFGDIISELKKVTWPTREETTRLTIAVVVVAIAIGLLLGGIDISMNWIVDHTLLR